MLASFGSVLTVSSRICDGEMSFLITPHIDDSVFSIAISGQRASGDYLIMEGNGDAHTS